MTGQPGATASTPEATEAVTQSRGEAALGASPAAAPEKQTARQDDRYELGAGIKRRSAAPHERARNEPLYRPLRIFTIDPAVPRLDGAVALVNVPYEPLAPGPVGALFKVDNYDGFEKIRYRRADLDSKEVLIRDGYDPSQSDPRFHQQMVYAVCSTVYAAFRKALGRHLGWGPGVQDGKLLIKPHADHARNAYYDERAGELRFGYFEADQEANDNTLPGGFVFTCLSHDIVTHEVTHALLDGLRAQFSQPSGPDVIAFHEAFADLVAIFQRFSYKEVVLNAIQKSHGVISEANYLTDLALQFGHTTGIEKALRSALDVNAERRYDDTLEPHALGSVLVAAIFEAFTTIYQRKSARYLRLATGGSGVLPEGELPHDLQNVLADRVAKLASQFLSFCIRAVDYCPPVGLTFGDYLRAIITADIDLVPDDIWDYRGALIQAFRRRNIYPRDVASLTEDALVWRPPRIALPPIEDLHFRKLQFSGEPGYAVETVELERQARALARCISRKEHMREFGLVERGDAELEGDQVTLPRIESIRTSRRTGPDGQIAFDLVAEVTQVRKVLAKKGRPAFEYHGGSTIILDPKGEVRFVILKSVLGQGRLDRRREFLQGAIGKRYWKVEGNAYKPVGELFKLVHKVEQPES
ncbi:MAG: peptidase M4 [Burkholderiales bacterium]|nr:peptidase M4 [Burkholderiales bacterium]